jgi:hypothetical protein
MEDVNIEWNHLSLWLRERYNLSIVSTPLPDIDICGRTNYSDDSGTYNERSTTVHFRRDPNGYPD